MIFDNCGSLFFFLNYFLLGFGVFDFLGGSIPILGVLFGFGGLFGFLGEFLGVDYK